MVEPAAAATPLERYFRAVDDGDFEAALELFSARCIYARPSLRSCERSDERHLEALVGKDAVRAFLEVRGTLPLAHAIHTAMIEHDQCFVEGTASSTEIADSGTIFMAHAKLDADSLITRFLALSTVIDAEVRRIIVPPH